MTTSTPDDEIDKTEDEQEEATQETPRHTKMPVPTKEQIEADLRKAFRPDAT